MRLKVVSLAGKILSKQGQDEVKKEEKKKLHSPPGSPAAPKRPGTHSSSLQVSCADTQKCSEPAGREWRVSISCVSAQDTGSGERVPRCFSAAMAEDQKGEYNCLFFVFCFFTLAWLCLQIFLPGWHTPLNIWLLFQISKTLLAYPSPPQTMESFTFRVHLFTNTLFIKYYE